MGWPPYQVRHDLGLYEVLWCLAMIPLFILLSRRKLPRGFYLGILPMLYSVVRFGLDFLRATDVEMADPRYFGLTPGHYSAIVLFSLGAVTLVLALRDPDPAIPENIALGAKLTSRSAGRRRDRSGGSSRSRRRPMRARTGRRSQGPAEDQKRARPLPASQ